MNTKHNIIRLRRGTASEWTNSLPQPGGEVLKLGEPGYEKDTGKLKIGDGTTPWNNLPYFNGGASITSEDLQDLLGSSGFLVEGDGIGIVYDDDNNTLTISNTKSTYDAAVEWTANHTLVDGTRYLAGDLVYSGGSLYKALFDNESEPVSNTTYWENLGSGYRLNIDGRDIPNIPNPFNQDLNTFNATSFDTVAITGSQIFGGGENSGDGNGYGTIELVPDSGLYNNDQYLIVDPTAPNHIHLRAGGTIDGSNAELIIGGEYAHLRVNDYNHNISIRASSGGNIQQFNLGDVSNNYCGGTEDVVSYSNIPLGSTFEYDNIVYTVNSLLNYDSENGVYCYNTSPTLPGEVLYGGGKIVGTFDLTLPYSTKDYTFGNDGVLQLANGGIKFSDNTTQTTAALSDSNTYIICKTGDDLIAKYAAAKLLTPGGNALSATNRATLIIMPGNYTLSEELVVDAEFVDILGLGSMKLDRGCVTAVTLLNNTINVSANDVRIKGITISGGYSLATSNPLNIIEDCVCTGYYPFFGGGTFINCVGGDYSFGTDWGDSDGKYVNCIAGNHSFGGGGRSANGIYINCKSESYSFGTGTASGYFENCVGGENSFGGEGGALSGTLLQCRLTSGTFPTLSGSGKIRLCIDGNYDVINADATPEI